MSGAFVERLLAVGSSEHEKVYVAAERAFMASKFMISPAEITKHDRLAPTDRAAVRAAVDSALRHLRFWSAMVGAESLRGVVQVSETKNAAQDLLEQLKVRIESEFSPATVGGSLKDAPPTESAPTLVNLMAEFLATETPMIPPGDETPEQVGRHYLTAFLGFLSRHAELKA